MDEDREERLVDALEAIALTLETIGEILSEISYNMRARPDPRIVARNCRQCGVPFTAGPGQGRRNDATFCSDICRITHNSLKRSREPGPGQPLPP
jgi:hypothetical protein